MQIFRNTRYKCISHSCQSPRDYVITILFIVGVIRWHLLSPTTMPRQWLPCLLKASHCLEQCENRIPRSKHPPLRCTPRLNGRLSLTNPTIKILWLNFLFHTTSLYYPILELGRAPCPWYLLQLKCAVYQQSNSFWNHLILQTVFWFFIVVFLSFGSRSDDCDVIIHFSVKSCHHTLFWYTNLHSLSTATSLTTTAHNHYHHHFRSRLKVTQALLTCLII